MPGGKEARDLITRIHSFTQHEPSELALPEQGCGRLQDIGDSCTVYGKAATELKYLPTTPGNAEGGLFLCLLEQQLGHTRNNVIVG